MSTETQKPVPNGHLTVTRSTCPECRALVTTRVFIRDSAVFFEKHCPTHGRFETQVSDDPQAYLAADEYHRVATTPHAFNKPWAKGCPQDCGICPEHEQHVCMPIIEITDHCDMQCPICLVQNQNSWHMPLPEFEKILDRLIETEGTIDVASLSGGEPTCHPEFEKMVEAGLRRKEILRLSVSTNGLRLARDEKLRRFLAERNVVISLQFDGTDKETLLSLRGGDFGSLKRQFIDDMGTLDAPLSLTYTLTGGLNEAGLSEAVELLFTRPNILSLMVQPAAFSGTARAFAGGISNRIFIPTTMKLLETYGNGRVKAADFSPLPCSHPNCFSLSFFLKTDEGRFLSIRQLFEPDTYLNIIKNRTFFGTDPDNFRTIENAVYELWSGPSALAPDSEKALKAVRKLLREMQCGGSFDSSRNLAIAERNIKSIFIHAFMDPDTFDITRVRKCCQVYPLRDGRFMPACVYNVLER